MNRRDFLKLAAVNFLAAVVPQWIHRFSLTVPGLASARDFSARLGGKLYKGTADGRILASDDGGFFWHCSANFGSCYQVKGLYAAGDRLYAWIGFPKGAFALVSVDGTLWRTKV